MTHLRLEYHHQKGVISMDEQTTNTPEVDLELQTQEWKAVKRKLFWFTACKTAGLTLIAAGLFFFLCAVGIIVVSSSV